MGMGGREEANLLGELERRLQTKRGGKSGF